MKDRTVVIGGGMVGRLVQYAVPTARVLDWGAPPRDSVKSMTRNWGTNYLWEPLTDIACRSFRVVTEIDGLPPTPESVSRYKTKIGKQNDGGDWGLQFQHIMLGYEPIDMPPAVIEYETRILEIDVNGQRLFTSKGEVVPYDVLVSTIPLDAFLKLIRNDDGLRVELLRITGTFHWRPIYIKVSQRPLDAPYSTDVFYVNYLSNPTVQPYRYCDRGQDRHYEGLTTMGAIPNRKLVPGKLVPPYPDTKTVLEVMRDCYNIHCFGRYGRWEPDELLHETDRMIYKTLGGVR